jgi:hypothetical protein
MESKYPIILSFDVGIVHLSYCLLTKKLDLNNNLNWHIIEWNNIDLTNSNPNLCHCGLIASHYNIIDNNNYYYCKKHNKPNINIKTFEEYFNKNTDKSFKCNHNCNNKICTKNCQLLCENNNYCTLHAKQYYKNIIKLSEVKLIKKLTDFNDLKYNLIIELEKRKSLLDANYVVIENQPSFKNPKMKSIASTLYDYYLIRGIIDKNITNSNIMSVKFISPINKLKLINNKDLNELDKTKQTENDSQKYKLTKSLGIKYCLENINHLTDWTTFFNNNKKKDDLADSFLQGIYFYNLIL